MHTHSEAIITHCVQIVSDRDKATRAAALGTLEVAYMSEGQAIWTQLGRLTDQQQSLIEERFKYTDKQVRRRSNLLADFPMFFASCQAMQRHCLQGAVT